MQKSFFSRIGFLARRVHQNHSALFEATFDEFKLTPIQWGVMIVVNGCPGLGQSEIAAQCGSDRVTISDVLTRLEERRVVTLVRSTQDRRQRLAYITDEGAALVRKLSPKVNRVQNQFLRSLKPKEAKALISLMSSLVESTNAMSNVAYTKANFGNDARIRSKRRG